MLRLSCNAGSSRFVQPGPIIYITFLFLATSEPQTPNQENASYDCMQNVTSLGKTPSPSNTEWRDDTNSSSPGVTPVCPVPLPAGDSPTYRSPFNKTNCRFSVMTSYPPYHQGLYPSTQEQAAMQHPYTVSHHFGAHSSDHPPSYYRYMPSELYPGNFLKGQDCVANGYVSLPISNQNSGGGLNNNAPDFSS